MSAADQASPAISPAPSPAIPAATADAALIERLAGEVLRYLDRHPHAADTIEGIAQWWITQQRLEDSRAQVQAALDRLQAQGLIEVVPAAGGRHRYRLRPSGTAAGAGAGEGGQGGDATDPDRPPTDGGA